MDSKRLAILLLFLFIGIKKKNLSHSLIRLSGTSFAIRKTRTESALQVQSKTELTTQWTPTPHSDKTFSCYGVKNDGSWTYTPAFSYVNCSNSDYLGPYGSGGSISTTYNSSKPHRSVAIGFNLILIDSWENESFYVTADGVTVYNYTHSNFESISNICQNSWADSEVQVRFGFNHTDKSLELVFTSTLDEDSDNEAWGICDLTIDLHTGYTYPNGNQIASIKQFTFSCASPQEEDDWFYVPAYQTVTCSGRTFVGGYAAGDSIKTVLDIPHSHEGMIVHFKLALIGSWTENHIFTVSVDGNTAYTYTYNASTTFSYTAVDSCDESTTVTYYSAKFGVNHSSSTIELIFTSNIEESDGDVAWAICDVFINPFEHPVLASGYAYGGIIKRTIFNSLTDTFEPFYNYVPKYSLFDCDGTVYLGPYGAGAEVSAYLVINQEHQGLYIDFTVALFDTWENETFTVKVDGEVVYQITHTHDMSGSNLCMSAWNDYTHYVQLGLNHTSRVMIIEFTSDLDQLPEDESWGIDGLNIHYTTSPISSAGQQLGLIKSPVFSCVSPVYDPDWTYEPAFQTFTCGGNTYVGGYASGGFLNVSFYFLEKHHGITVEFNLALTDQWNDNSLMVYGDGVLVYTHTHTYNESAKTSKCGSEYEDTLTRVKFGFNHSSFTLVLTFISDLTGSTDEAAWGVCDMNVNPTFGTVSANGDELVAIKVLTMSCEAPTEDLQWIYAPAFDTITGSNGNTYVGEFGAAGNMISKLRVPLGHSGIIVSFKLALFDTWEGEEFYIIADENLVYLFKYDSNSTKSKEIEVDDDGAYLDVTFGFNHSSNILQLEFTSNIYEDLEDKSWGICDLSIVSTTSYVDINGNEL